MSWLTIAKYVAPGIALIALLWWIHTDGYHKGEMAANHVCKEQTVPLAVAKQQKLCKDNAAKTEKSNAQKLVDAKSAADRANHQLEWLRKTYRSVPCVPVTAITGVGKDGTTTIQPATPSGINAGDIVELGRACQERSSEYLNLRSFVIENWK